MSGNIIPLWSHLTFSEKVSNFPDDVYSFNDGDNLTTIMSILLGNSGTGQLRNVQLAARLGQQNLEFSNLDTIMGIILDIKRNSSEIYSFSTNPFIDQLTSTEWQEVISKDASYRERLLGAAEAFQTGATVWSIIALAEAMTQMRFYAMEGWRNPSSGRTGIDHTREIILYPLTSDDSFWSWDQGKVRSITAAVNKIIPANFVVSFASPIATMTHYPLSDIVAPTSSSTVVSGFNNGYSEFFNLQATVHASQVTTPSTIQPGAASRYWLQNNAASVAPYFAHLQSQEISIDLTGTISNVSSTDKTGVPYESVALPSMSVTSTVYGAQ